MKPGCSIVLILAAAACAAPGVVPRSPAGLVRETPDLALVIVRIHAPWYAPRFVMRRKFEDALGEYEAIGALEAKYFSITDDREFGGLYVWSSRAAADQHFSAAWRADVRERRGVDPDVQTLQAALVVEGSDVPLGEDRGARSLAYPASATWARWPAAAASPQSIASSLAREPGLIRGFVTVDRDAPSSVGVVAVWSSRAAADRATAPDHLPSRDAVVVHFETPLLIDATLRSAADASRGASR